ncbi:antitermination NusB domain-containing protein [Striga hermonthica]|uniref:Antitermination NusB domain-containing protein n=1 Tax=Striga hermonthica TaxID=68872 RepID=A0A9N7N955_STRHE|nr:antitermination NusB domain-containing protein [Striga hermonthica]
MMVNNIKTELPYPAPNGVFTHRVLGFGAPLPSLGPLSSGSVISILKIRITKPRTATALAQKLTRPKRETQNFALPEMLTYSFHQYQVVERALPATKEHPKIFRMKLCEEPKFCFIVNSPARFSCGTSLPRLTRLKSSPITITQVVEELTPDSVAINGTCLDGSDPVRLFEKRLSARREPGYEFDKVLLMEYDHMSFGGPPVTTETAEEADDILQNDEKESGIEAEVLSAPPKLVYSKLILRFTRKLLVAVTEKWDNNVLAIGKVAPSNWKNQPAARILEFSVLHLAMSEIAVLGTRHQIVINEAVDLAKRFCDGAAPRIINGCLRTFVKELNQNGETENVKIVHTV